MNSATFSALVIDDEPQMLDIVTFALETQDFTTTTARDAESAWQILQSRRFDLLVLDIMLPQSSGLSLCRRIRETSQVPIILLTARGEVQDRVIGLEAGADDYVSKPFHPRELALRAEALVRRSTPHIGQVLTLGALRLAEGRVSVSGAMINLSDIELRLLRRLMAEPGQVVGFADLILAGWQREHGPGSREMLKTALYRLRQRLQAAGLPKPIRSVRSQGYLLAVAEH